MDDSEEAPAIRELDERTVERIAAGEVVERPASVVKELVENALDADATRIDVAVDAGGTDGIRVSDDGIGMTEREVRRAVEKHTTSKIRDVEDLESGVGTLGFRGEALHAIGAVSRMTVETRSRDGGQGSQLTIEGGEVSAVDPAGCPAGTTVTIEDLFFNVPARRKYLKQDTTEFSHVNRVVTSYALANPDVAVTLSHNGRETFATTGGGDRREAVMAVYGREVAEAMLEVDGAGSDRGDADGTDELPDGPLTAVAGLVSHPETTRAGREYLSTYVNGRYVTASAVQDAVLEAYGTQLAPDRYPFAVLFLSVDPATVDVNVHPRKLEVRFADEAGVRRQVEAAVESALLREGLLRSGAPRGKSAPEQTEIRAEAETQTGDATAGDAPEAGGSSDDAGRVTETETAAQKESTAPSGESTGAHSVPDQTESRALEQDDSPGTNQRKFVDAGTQMRLGGDDEDPVRAEGFDSLPAMRVLGQLHDTYVVAETPDGLVLLDQHAADERVNYERLKAEFAGQTATQVLAEEVTLSLTAREAELFEGFADALARIGFRAERVGNRTIEVRTVPSLVAETADPELLRTVLSSFVDGEGAAAETVEAAADELLADLACYPSVTGNTSLTEGSVRDLLEALDGCDNPYACPHGRPVLVEIDGEELEARFERDYPGHGGRRQ